MIQVQNITKSFDGFRALDDLSFTVPHGAVYGLVGPNGAGKSTVLRCITGIYRPDAGLVSVGGLPVWENPAVKRRMAFIPDDLSAHAGDSIREMAGLMQKLYPRFDLSRYGQLREVFQLDEKKPLRRFSKGMQKQAAFWLAICAKPDYLDPRRAGRRPRPRDAPPDLEHHLGGRRRARDNGARLVAQPARAGGRLRSRRRHAPWKAPARAEPLRPAGQHGQGAARHGVSHSGRTGCGTQ